MEAAARRLGLAPRPTEFFEAPVDVVYHQAAYLLPGMYHHWSFGRNYARLRVEFDQGLSRFYELVTNTRPAYAYLLDHNSLSEQLFVIAHVLGHADLFDRNALLRAARTDMVPFLTSARRRFEEYEHRHGLVAVERVIDLGHALQPHVADVPEDRAPPPPARRPSDPYADLLPRRQEVPTPAERQRRRRAERWGTPCPDPLYFLIRWAPLRDWERDVLGVIRECGLRILREVDLPPESEVITARMHAQVASADRLWLNPYWLGWQLFEHLAESGVDVFAVAAQETSASLLRNWVDEAFVHKHRLYRWVREERGDEVVWKVASRQWEVVRDTLASIWQDRGVPRVRVEEVTAEGALCLLCEDERPLDLGDARRVLHAMARLWRGPVRLVGADGRLLLEVPPDWTWDDGDDDDPGPGGASPRTSPGRR
jgi:stage V sporulation protein R